MVRAKLAAKARKRLLEVGRCFMHRAAAACMSGRRRRRRRRLPPAAAAVACCLPPPAGRVCSLHRYSTA